MIQTLRNPSHWEDPPPECYHCGEYLEGNKCPHCGGGEDSEPPETDSHFHGKKIVADEAGYLDNGPLAEDRDCDYWNRVT